MDIFKEFGLVHRMGTYPWNPQNMGVIPECPKSAGFSQENLLIQTQCVVFHKMTTINALFCSKFPHL